VHTVREGSCVWPAVDIPMSARRTPGSVLLLQPETDQEGGDSFIKQENGEGRLHRPSLR
jgi:hypothetical protein